MALSSLLLSGLWLLSEDNLIVTLAILPFSMFLSILVGWKRMKKLEFSVLPYVLYYIRDVVAVFFLIYSDYASIIPLIDSKELIFVSVIMLSIENLFTLKFWFINIKVGNFLSSVKHYFGSTEMRNLRVIFLGVIFISGTWILVPQLKENYSSIFIKDFASLSVEETNNTVNGGVERALLTISLMYFDIFRLFAGLYILNGVDKLSSNYLVRWFVLFLTIVLQLCFVTANTMMTLLVIAILLHVFFLNNRVGKAMNYLLFVLSVPTLLFLVGSKVSDESTLEYSHVVSILLNSYVPGFVNLLYFNSLELGYSYWDVLVSNLYTMIPFRHSLIGLDVGPHLMEIFNKKLVVRGQVLPFLGEARYFFGFGYILVPSLFLRVSRKFWYYAVGINDIYTLGVSRYISLYLLITPFMYNSTIIGAFIFTALPTWKILNFSRIRLRRVAR